MATLPDFPANTAAVVGGIATLALIAYQSKLRTSIEAKVHENYRDFKLIDAGIAPETETQLKIAKQV